VRRTPNLVDTTLSLHDALPILIARSSFVRAVTSRSCGSPSSATINEWYRDARNGAVNPLKTPRPLCSIVDVFPCIGTAARTTDRSEEHTSELQSLRHLVCRLLL